jgi:hypothetical protein
MLSKCVISGFRCEVAKNCAFFSEECSSHTLSKLKSNFIAAYAEPYKTWSELIEMFGGLSVT